MILYHNEIVKKSLETSKATMPLCLFDRLLIMNMYAKIDHVPNNKKIGTNTAILFEFGQYLSDS